VVIFLVQTTDENRSTVMNWTYTFQ